MKHKDKTPYELGFADAKRNGAPEDYKGTPRGFQIGTEDRKQYDAGFDAGYDEFWGSKS